jgi:hypothetical protein
MLAELRLGVVGVIRDLHLARAQDGLDAGDVGAGLGDVVGDFWWGVGRRKDAQALEVVRQGTAVRGQICLLPGDVVGAQHDWRRC